MHATIFFIALSAITSPQTWSYKKGAHPSVTVENVSGSVRVRGRAGDAIELTAKVTGGSPADRGHYTLDVKERAEGLEVRVCCGASCSEHSHHDHDCPGDVEVELALEVPAGSELEAREVAGPITVVGVMGAQRVQSVSGSVDVTTEAAKLNVSSVSGDVRVSGGKDVEASSVSGSLQVQKARGEVRARTVSGNAKIALAAGEKPQVAFQTTSGDLEFTGLCGEGCRLRARSVSGDVRLTLAAQSSFQLRYKSQSGQLKDELPVAASEDKAKFMGRDVEARYGSGAGEVECKTLSGGLRLSRQ